MLGVVVLKSSQGQASSCQLMFGTNRLYASNTRCLFPHSLCVCHTLLPHSLTHCRAFYHSILHLFHPSHFMLLQSVLSPRQPPTVITSVISWLMNCALMSPWNNFTGLYFNYLFILFLFFLLVKKFLMQLQICYDLEYIKKFFLQISMQGNQLIILYFAYIFNGTFGVMKSSNKHKNIGQKH